MSAEGGEMPLVKIYVGEDVWKIWLDGRMDGFPDDVFVINHALEAIRAVIARESVER